MKKKVLFLAVAVAFCFAACATTGPQMSEEDRTVSYVYRTLKSAATMYEMVMPAIADARERGLINEDDVVTIYSLAYQYWAAYHAATDALFVYEKGRTQEGFDKLTTTVSEMTLALDRLTDYARPFLAK